MKNAIEIKDNVYCVLSYKGFNEILHNRKSNANTYMGVIPKIDSYPVLIQTEIEDESDGYIYQFCMNFTVLQHEVIIAQLKESLYRLEEIFNPKCSMCNGTGAIHTYTYDGGIARTDKCYTCKGTGSKNNYLKERV